MPNNPRARRSVALIALLALLGGCKSAPPGSGPEPEPAAPPATAAGASVAPTVAPRPPEPPAAEPTPAYLPEIDIRSVVNFRDAAGTGAGLPLAGGGHMVRGLVFRSAALETISGADLDKLESLAITDVYDLRTPNVAAAHPDPKIGDATVHPINLYATKKSKNAAGSTPEKRVASRVKINREFVTGGAERKRLAVMLNSFAKAPGPVIVHCSEGKDRTGFAVAVLQLVAGVDEDTIMDEYLLSNEYRKELIDEAVAKAGAKKAKATRMDLSVFPQQLQASLDAIDDYGGVDAFLTDGVGLSKATVAALREKLTAP